jgi:hypothetical protein
MSVFLVEKTRSLEGVTARKEPVAIIATTLGHMTSAAGVVKNGRVIQK